MSSNPLNNATTSDTYTDACTIRERWNSRGGAFLVANAAVYIQLQFGRLGTDDWTEEIFTLPTTGTLERGAVGIRFRSAVAGTPALVTAIINEGPIPGIVGVSQYAGTL